MNENQKRNMKIAIIMGISLALLLILSRKAEIKLAEIKLIEHHYHYYSDSSEPKGYSSSSDNGWVDGNCGF